MAVVPFQAGLTVKASLNVTPLKVALGKSSTG